MRTPTTFADRIWHSEHIVSARARPRCSILLGWISSVKPIDVPSSTPRTASLPTIPLSPVTARPRGRRRAPSRRTIRYLGPSGGPRKVGSGELHRAGGFAL